MVDKISDICNLKEMLNWLTVHYISNWLQGRNIRQKNVVEQNSWFMAAEKQRRRTVHQKGGGEGPGINFRVTPA